MIVRALFLVVAVGTSAQADEDPDTEVARRLFQQGTKLYVANEYEKALAAFEGAKLAKPLPRFDFNIALCHDRLGRWPEALGGYERFLQSSPDPADAKEAEARIAVLRDRVRTAPLRAQADDHYNKAILHFNTGAYLPAAEELKLAFLKVPNPLYLYSLGQAYRMANDAPNAVRYYEDFLKLVPASPQRAAVEARLKQLKAGPLLVKSTSGNASERLKPVAELIKVNRKGFRGCFDAWALRHPGAGGKVVLSFLLDPDGAISQTKAETKGFDSPEVAGCIVQLTRTLSYPAATSGKYTRFNYPFDFQPN